MSSNTRFKLGQSGNPQTRFQPGNRYRWQPGQSGNTAGVACSRLQFEEAFYTALLEQGSAEEAATLLWDSARKREPWAVQALLQRLAPEANHINLTHHVNDHGTIDYTRLTDAELEQLEGLLKQATAPVAEPGGGEGETQPE